MTLYNLWEDKGSVSVGSVSVGLIYYVDELPQLEMTRGHTVCVNGKLTL